LPIIIIGMAMSKKEINIIKEIKLYNGFFCERVKEMGHLHIKDNLYHIAY
jgi:hypothetical protein